MLILAFQEAKACIRDDRFTVLAGSKARPWDQSFKGWSYQTLQKKLVRNGRLQWMDAKNGVFTVDVAFSSSSAAAAIVNGAPTSGPANWVDESSGELLRQILQHKNVYSPDPTFVLTMPKIGVQARARLTGDRSGLIVMRGSIVRARWVGLELGYLNLHRQFLEDGTIELHSGILSCLTRDVEFSSSSAAASIVKGNNSNGRSDWKVAGAGETYYEWCLDEKALSGSDD